ncbi:unnamed protein product [Candidula unifasciata]|uniref:Anti-proliferative protein domain-containing protein n=1 Tax=Candidula unifasciata TaxID=100452 RepID=A0A8S3YWZ9_9EUPU|nr:unnamed protein product [Candidula unifasciata]
MKAEINAATEFLSKIFLAHDNIKKEKVAEFKQRLAALLEERFRNHWHESFPTKGQAYRCIRINPEECLDPLIEKVCNDVGVNVKDFNLPFELTLWVDPTEVVCKFGDLKCSYHTVAKKDQTSGNLNSQTEHLDIDDLVENARELYLKKQTVVVHPVNSTEVHVQSPYADGSPNSFTMAVRMSGTAHCNMSGSPPPGFDGSPRGRKPPHMTHKRGGGYHYYGKSSGGKGGFVANGVSNGATAHAASSHHGYPHHRSHNHHHHQQQHHHLQGSGGHHNPSVTYSNGYLNGYSDENGYAGFDHRSVSPTKINGMSVLPPLSITGGPVQISQSPPTPEQLQQQLQHPPPMPPSVPPHLQQTFSHPHTDISTLPPPPLPSQHQLPPPPATSASITTTSNNSSSSINNSSGSGSGKSTGHGSSSKFQGVRGHAGSRSKQSSGVKEVK